MKILVIGGAGTIGRKLCERLAVNHEVIVGGRNSGDVQIDIADAASIKQMYDGIKNLDAVVCVAGEAIWKPLQQMSEEDFYVGIRSKLMGQVNLVRLGLGQLNKGGSFTLTTGILADDPVLMTSSAATVNGAIHSFVKAASLEMPEAIRLNVVCPELVEDAAEKYGSFFPGHTPVAMERVVDAYVQSIEGRMNGEIIRVY